MPAITNKEVSFDEVSWREVSESVERIGGHYCNQGGSKRREQRRKDSMAPSPVKKSKQALEKEKAAAAAAAQAEATVDVTSDDEDDQEDAKEETAKSKADESNAMEKLTDVVEENQMDEDKMKTAFLALRKQEEADKEAERKREKQLAAVKVKKEDVELIAREMEVTTQIADRKLREADGDVVQCLTALVA